MADALLQICVDFLNHLLNFSIVLDFIFMNHTGFSSFLKSNEMYGKVTE